MARETITDAPPSTSLLKRIASRSPLVVGVYAVGSLALGYGFGNPGFDALALVATTGGYAIGDGAVRKLRSHVEGIG